MAQLIVRGLEDDVKERLQRRAARHGRSMEAEACDILRAALRRDAEPCNGLGSKIAARFTTIGLTPQEAIGELSGTDVRDPFQDDRAHLL